MSTLTDEEVYEAFGEEIKKGEISLGRVREKFRELACFRSFQDDVRKSKKVLDTVRYRIKKNQISTNNEEDLKNSSDDESLASNTDYTIDKYICGRKDAKFNQSDLPDTRVRKVYTAGDMQLIKKHLSCYTNSSRSIIRSEFQEYVFSKPELKQFVEKFGIMSLIVKMQTERKK